MSEQDFLHEWNTIYNYLTTVVLSSQDINKLSMYDVLRAINKEKLLEKETLHQILDLTQIRNKIMSSTTEGGIVSQNIVDNLLSIKKTLQLI